jgi:hypothetical protein
MGSGDDRELAICGAEEVEALAAELSLAWLGEVEVDVDADRVLADIEDAEDWGVPGADEAEEWHLGVGGIPEQGGVGEVRPGAERDQDLPHQGLAVAVSEPGSGGAIADLFEVAEHGIQARLLDLLEQIAGVGGHEFLELITRQDARLEAADQFAGIGALVGRDRHRPPSAKIGVKPR